MTRNWQKIDLLLAADFSKVISIFCMIIIHALSYASSPFHKVSDILQESIIIGFFMGMTSNFLITSGFSLGLKESKGSNSLSETAFHEIIKSCSLLLIINFFFQLFSEIGAESLKYGNSIFTIGISTIIITFFWRIHFWLVPISAIISAMLGVLFKDDIFLMIGFYREHPHAHSGVLGWIQIICYLFLMSIFFLYLLSARVSQKRIFIFISTFFILLASTFFSLQSPSNFSLFFIKLFWGSPDNNVLFPLFFWFPRIALGWCLYMILKKLPPLGQSYRNFILVIALSIYFLFPYFSGKMNMSLFSYRSYNLWDTEFNSEINIRIIVLSVLFNIIIIFSSELFFSILPKLKHLVTKISSISLYLFLVINSDVYKPIVLLFSDKPYYIKVLMLILFYSLVSIAMIKLFTLISQKQVVFRFKKIKS